MHTLRASFLPRADGATGAGERFGRWLVLGLRLRCADGKPSTEQAVEARGFVLDAARQNGPCPFPRESLGTSRGCLKRGVETGRSVPPSKVPRDPLGLVSLESNPNKSNYCQRVKVREGEQGREIPHGEQCTAG